MGVDRVQRKMLNLRPLLVADGSSATFIEMACHRHLRADVGGIRYYAREHLFFQFYGLLLANVFNIFTNASH